MNKEKVNEILHDWLEIHGDKATEKYSVRKLEEIAVNCVSLSETWLGKVNKNEAVSFSLSLYDKDGAIADTMQGVDRNNLSNTIFGIIVSHGDTYSKISLMKYAYVGGEKKIELVGELEIS